ncbi:MAG: ATP-binding cassette domain-containing protein, partial [Polyangiaceae bacterium]
ARENVTLVARLDGKSRTELEPRVADLAELVGLSSAHLDRHPGQLSGGERQRVGLMRALALDPDVLLLDEPLGALDPIVRAKLQEDLKMVFGSLGKCVVFVTHDLAEAAFLADTIALLHDGAIVQTGTMRELVDTPADDFVRTFVRAQRSLAEALR